MDCSTLGFPILHHLPGFAQTHVHWVSDAINHLILFHLLLLLPSIFPSIRVFSNELALCIRWPKYWGFSFWWCVKMSLHWGSGSRGSWLVCHLGPDFNQFMLHPQAMSFFQKMYFAPFPPVSHPGGGWDDDVDPPDFSQLKLGFCWPLPQFYAEFSCAQAPSWIRM